MPAEAEGIGDRVAVIAAAGVTGHNIEVDRSFRSPVFSVRVATPSGGDATGFGCVPIRADASLAELGNVDVVVLPPILDGLDNSLAAHPDLIVWLKSLAADDVLLMSRKHPQ